MEDRHRETTVMIVGGGPAGLSMAALLGRLGVDCLVIERRGEVNPHPRARSINVRTNEIFRPWGIADALAAVSLPEPWTRRFVYCETLSGREIGRTEMAVQPVVDGVVHSPAAWMLSSQDQIEPVIATYAGSLPGVTVAWGTELMDAVDDRDAVTASVRDDTGMSTVRARWLVAADGAASRVRRQLGIELVGQTDLATLVNCHFHADLGRWTDDRPAALYWTTAPARNVFQKIDTEDRWLCQIGYDPREHSPSDFDRVTAADWIRRSVGDDSLEVDVLDVIPWTMSSTVAERLRHGRCFLIGDAAHQLPPSGGFGMNTAVQDAHNLAWKLAFVEHGWAADALLDTYHTERAPVARYNADRSLENTRSVGRIRRIAEQGGDATMTAAEAVAASGRYGNWLGMDLGLRYEEGCLVTDGSKAPDVADPVSEYAPTARPGHRAPHVPLRIDGHLRSSLDLFDDAFVLLLGAGVPAVSGPSEVGGARVGHEMPLRVVHVDHDAIDVEQRFESAYGVGPTGAVLVRPDGHVAWRSTMNTESADDLRAGAAQLMVRLLGADGTRPSRPISVTPL